ncbi:TIGR04206 family protein [Halorarius litoreus]|uniref:TIGR04206 family protein n=1 Tax=Halorarius litoreus TaxID=2962676 RepID=UPI0020CE0EEB|nr:TIGR04206 family protein [Halorarius litoreus]
MSRLAHASARRRLAALLALSLVPWTLFLIDGGRATLVFPLFVLDYNPALDPVVRVVPVYRFFLSGGGLPRNPGLWPASILLYLVAVASAASGALFDREDVRLTAGALTFAGLAHVGVSYAFSHRIAWTPFPVGLAVVFGVVWWFYWPALRAALFAPVSEQ